MVPSPANDSDQNQTSPDVEDKARSTANSVGEPSVDPQPDRSPLLAILGYFAQPILIVLAGVIVIGLLGLAQKMEWLMTADSHDRQTVETDGGGDVEYICPMMCTPPQKEPGRCPVCAMELVPASSGASGGDERSIVVDPASRRVANIQTVTARSMPVTRTIQAVGELHYDESKLKTISAYTNGRFDRLYVDFTGAEVRKGDRLASFYSPELYSAQIEYLQASKTAAKLSESKLTSVTESNQRLMDNSKQRLIELGMTAEQIATIEKENEVRSRMDIVAPMSGTVIEKVAIEGEYVKEGQPIFKLADLSSVWLLLELFPADAAVVCNGQSVDARLKSLPGRTFSGHVTFIAPEVDPKSRTVSVRVAINNHDGILRIGDYAKATIMVPQTETEAIAVPRNAVLMAADHAVVYVETEPGRFEIRRVERGNVSRDEVIILKGLAEGESVAINGNFLVDSQMQLAGNPSLIDPTRAAAPRLLLPGLSPELLAELDRLPAGDRSIALEQVICPVTDLKLGSMGVPPKVMVNGQPVFLCCEGCRESLLKDVNAHLEKLQQYRSGKSQQEDDALDDSLVPPLGIMESFNPVDDFPPLGEMELVPSVELKPIDTATNPGRILK